MPPDFFFLQVTFFFWSVNPNDCLFIINICFTRLYLREDSKFPQLHNGFFKYVESSVLLFPKTFIKILDISLFYYLVFLFKRFQIYFIYKYLFTSLFWSLSFTSFSFFLSLTVLFEHTHSHLSALSFSLLRWFCLFL